jgi:hypothetical protein
MQKLAIVGSHFKTRENAPFNDPSYIIWAFNEAAQDPFCKRWDVVFQLHKPEVYSSVNNMVNVKHWDWLQQDHGVAKTVYMQALDEIVMMLPAAKPSGQPFFTSSASMALALALYLGYEHIEVYGVDLSSGTEYQYQQLCWLYWCGVARAMIGEGFKLMSGEQHVQARVYGYEGEIQIDRNYFVERATVLEDEFKTQEVELAKLRAKLSDCLASFDPKRYSALIGQAQDVAIALGEAKGALDEAQAYANRQDPISRQQFERRGATAQRDGEQAKIEMYKAWGEMLYVWNTWALTKDSRARDQVKTFSAKMLNLAVTTGGNSGVWQENARYLIEYDDRVTAAGGMRTQRALGLEV